MRSVHFDAQGFTRTYWDFFSAFGLFSSVFLSFAAVLAWLLGGLPAETLARVRGIAWALAICFLADLVVLYTRRIRSLEIDRDPHFFAHYLKAVKDLTYSEIMY